MKIKLSLFLLFGISVLILSTQGIMMFNVFKWMGNWQLKTFVQPLGFALIFFYFIFLRKNRKTKITTTDILLFGYFALTLVMLVYNASGIKPVYIAIREVYLLYLAIFVFKQMKLPDKYYDIALKLIYYLTLLNIVFALLVYVVGVERYMKILIGEFFWGTHDEYKFKISNFVGSKLYRVPALLGESVAVGHFGALSFFLLKNHPQYRRKAYWGLVLVAFCFTRSVYLIVALYFVFLAISSSKKIQRYLLYALPVVPVVVGLMIWKNLFDIKSFIMRLQFWQEKMTIDSNGLFGGNIGKIGGALIAKNKGFLSVIDNYWIFIYYSIGWIGIVLILLYFYEQTSGKKDLKMIVGAILISGMFITLTQSMVILVLMPLLFIQNNVNLMKYETGNKGNQ